MPFGSWHQFEKEFLTAQKGSTEKQPDDQLSWSQFETEFLIFPKKQLSLEKK
jgi:hypothetical protein